MIRTRIAPSPTGQDLHVGTVATALINWAWAKKNKGAFVVRIEDTDRARLVKGSEERMLRTLDKIGLKPDESPLAGGQYGPYRQSERLLLYQKYAKELVEKKAAYYCTCTKERLDQVRAEKQKQKQIPKYDRHCLTRQEEVMMEIKKGVPYVIRLNVPPNKEVVLNDLVRGEIRFKTNDIDDQVLLKSDGFPTYHLAVVVDDRLMKISHVIRAEEWLSSTPKHILLYQAFGWELPVFAHVSLLRNPDRSKLSKRKNPVWASWYLNQGILPEALLNYLALTGWSHPEGKEIFNRDEYVRVFDLKDLQKTAPIFDPVKLTWMNGEYIRRMSDEDLKNRILKYIGEKYPTDIVEKTIPLIKERVKKLSDYLPLCEFFFKTPEKYEIDLSEKEDLLKKIHDTLATVKEWKANMIGEAMQRLTKELGVKTGEFFMVLRVAVTGKKISPPLNESMEILGKDECLERIKKLT
jgi:glutamyl-tRNA synthetase